MRSVFERETEDMNWNVCFFALDAQLATRTLDPLESDSTERHLVDLLVWRFPDVTVGAAETSSTARNGEVRRRAIMAMLEVKDFMLGG